MKELKHRSIGKGEGKGLEQLTFDPFSNMKKQA